VDVNVNLRETVQKMKKKKSRGLLSSWKPLSEMDKRNNINTELGSRTLSTSFREMGKLERKRYQVEYIGGTRLYV